MPHRHVLAAVLGAVMVLSPAAGTAGEADVVGAKATKSSDGSYTFEVTVRHGDTGWEHYANRWDVLGPDGTILGTRTLAHPHEHEQPFTRSLRGVRIPDGVDTVTVRAHDSVHNYGGAEVQVAIPR